MSVKELIEHLSKMDPSRIVILSMDEEGNGYRMLGNISDEYQYKDRNIGLEKLSEKDKQHGYTEEDMMTDGTPAVVLW